jgi:hypothetical protein
MPTNAGCSRPIPIFIFSALVEAAHSEHARPDKSTLDARCG